MKEGLAIFVYSVVFLILSVAGAGVLFLFALPFSLLLLAGVIVWGVAELVRFALPHGDPAWREVRLGPSRRISRTAALDLRAQLARPGVAQAAAIHRLQFVPHARRRGMRGRMIALSMRHPHHAHAHSA